MGLPSRREVRALTATAVAAVGTLTGAGLGSLAAGATVPTRGADPTVWTDQVCRRLVDVQAGALDARDALWAAADGAAPADKAARAGLVADLRAAVGDVEDALDRLDARLGRAAPQGAGGAAVRDGLREGYAALADAYADADTSVKALRRTRPAEVPAAIRTLLRRLDRATERAGRALARMEPAVRRSVVSAPLTDSPACHPIGPDWAFLLDADDAATPRAPAGADTLPGAVDLTAPPLLLPGRYRPPADVAALAAQTTMTGRGRTHFYGAVPAIETGSPFVADCPAADAENAQILGCYHDGRIYVLAVSRPEVAPIVPVTAAHEMLHAVYDAATDEERAAVDGFLTDFYETTTDARLRAIVAQYDARAPANRLTELHSLVPTQVPVLTPALETYFADYFRDRTPIVAAYEGYMALFEGLIAQYDALVARIEGLRATITDLRGQSDAAAGEAQRLALQIDALRAQGRIGESNDLVPAQNAAVRRAQAHNDEANRLVDEHNGLLDQVNAIADQIGGLESSLRPLG